MLQGLRLSSGVNISKPLSTSQSAASETERANSQNNALIGMHIYEITGRHGKAAEYDAVSALRRIASLAQSRSNNDETAWTIGTSKRLER